MKRNRILPTALALSILIGASACNTEAITTPPSSAVTTETTAGTTTADVNRPGTTYPPATVPTYVPPVTVPVTYPPATVPTYVPPVTVPVTSSATSTQTSAATTQTTTSSKPDDPNTPTSGSANPLFQTHGNWCEVTGWESHSVSQLTIPAYHNGLPVKKIGNNAFRDGEALLTVILPETLTEIEKDVFDGAHDLQYNVYGGALYLGTADNPYFALIRAEHTDITSCVFHEDTRLVANGAFADCHTLTSVTLPEGLERLGREPFAKDTPLCYAEYDGGLYLGSKESPYLFLMGLSGNADAELTVHSSTKRIEHRAVGGVPMERITLPSGLRSIAAEAFYDAYGDFDVTVPEGCLVETNAFSNAALGHLYISANVTLEAYAVTNGKLLGATIAEGHTEIPDGLFLYCLRMQEIHLPSTIRTIGEQAFKQCTKLLFVDLPDGLVSIGHEAFQLCENLVSVTFPSTLVEIDSWAFHACNRLRTLYLPESIRTVGEHAFADCKELTQAVIDAQIETLENSTFHHCIKLRSVTLPQTLKTIKSNVFAYCPIQVITLPEGFQTIGQNAFSDCGSLVILNLPRSLKTIGDGAFTEVAYGFRLTYPGSAAEFSKVSCGLNFQYRNSIEYNTPPDDGSTTIPVPNVYVQAESHPFRNHFTFELMPDGSGYRITSFHVDAVNTSTALSIPAEYNGKPIVSIGARAFAYLQGIYQLEMPKTIREIGDYAFFGANQLKRIHFYGDLDAIGVGAFADTALEEIVLPERVGAIGDCAFENCGKLRTVIMPKHLGYLGGSAFANTALSVIVFRGVPEQAGSNVFFSTNTLARITWEGTEASYRAFTAMSPHWLDATNENGKAFVVCTDEVVKETDDLLTRDGFLFEELASGEGFVIRAFDPALCSQSGTLMLPTAFQDKPVIGVRPRVFYTQVNGGVTTAYARISVPEGYRFAQEYAFTGRYYGITLPRTLTYLGDHALEGHRSTEIILPEGTTEIAAGTFSCWYELRTVTVPEGVTVIGKDAFSKSGIQEINLPKSIVFIGRNAFGGCRSLQIVGYDGTMAECQANIAMHFPSGVTFYCTDGSFQK